MKIKKQERQRLQEELAYYPSEEDSDVLIEQLRGLPSEESKSENEFSLTAQPMRKQRQLSEWKTQMEW